jgi:hypothetical protein
MKMKNKIIFISFLLFFPNKSFCQPFLSASIGMAMPSGKVSGIGLINLKPLEFEASKFYNNSFNSNFAIGYEKKGRLRIIFEYDFILLNITKTGQIVSDFSTSYTEKTKIYYHGLNLLGSYNLANSQNNRFIPFAGIGPGVNWVVVSASGFESSSVSGYGIVLVGGIDIKIGKNYLNYSQRRIKIDVRYTKAFSLSTIPDTFRINLSFQP